MLHKETYTCALANNVEHTWSVDTHRRPSLTHRSGDLPFVIGALDKDLKGQDRIGLAACQHLRAICGSSLEVGCPAAPSASVER